MKIAAKIMGCQLVLVAFILVNGLYSIYSSNNIQQTIHTVESDVLGNEKLLGDIRFLFSEVKSHTKSFFLTNATDEKTAVQELYGQLSKVSANFTANNQDNPKSLAALEQLMTEIAHFKNENEALDQLLAQVSNPTVKQAILGGKLNAIFAVERSIDEKLSVLFADIEQLSDAKLSSIRGAASTQIAIATTVMGISIAVALLLASLLTKNIASPLRSVVEMIQTLEQGHLDRRLRLQRKDEIGRMADTLDGFADNLQDEVVGSLQKMAAGDMTVVVVPRNEQDVVRGALKKLGEDLNAILSQVQGASEQISSGSTQVSDSSQSLSQGATEQAASLQQIAASMNQMAAQTQQTSEHAGQASQLSTRTRQAAEQGNQQMQTMVSAMAEINQSSKNISRIIKTIDEIAFQTNLLALNAAVEAARAGIHGKGFAVVAEEVRNLAARSAKAARETAELIEGSVRKTEQGAQIADATAAALGEIVGGITQVSQLVGEIATAGNEQAQGIAQVNIGLGQIDQVTQGNTATAEETAAASIDLSSQAERLRQLLGRFELQNQTAPRPSKALPTTSTPHRAKGGNIGQAFKSAVAPRQMIALDDEEFGRY